MVTPRLMFGRTVGWILQTRPVALQPGSLAAGMAKVIVLMPWPAVALAALIASRRLQWVTLQAPSSVSDVVFTTNAAALTTGVSVEMEKIRATNSAAAVARREMNLPSRLEPIRLRFSDS